MRKRVAIIIPGGVGTGHFNQGIPALMNLIDGLSFHFELTVYSLVTVSSDFKTSNYQIRAIDADHGDWTPGRVVRLSGMIMKDHRNKQYDLFHGFWGIPCGTMAVVLGKLFKRPSIVSLQGGEAAYLPEINYGYLISPKKKRRLFKTLLAASQVTALTYFQRDELRKHGFDGKEIEVIPYGVDTTKFRPFQKDFDGPLQFIHVANLTEVKDQETMLRAFRIIRDKIDCKLRIIGGDFMNGKLQLLCEQLNLVDSVDFLGSIRNNDLPMHYDWAHVLLHTSLYEAQAVSVSEAAACKVLLCGTHVGLLADFATFGIFTSPIKDYRFIAESLLSAINDNTNNRKDMIEKAYKWSVKHDIIYTCSRYAGLYDQLILNNVRG